MSSESCEDKVSPLTDEQRRIAEGFYLTFIAPLLLLLDNTKINIDSRKVLFKLFATCLSHDKDAYYALVNSELSGKGFGEHITAFKQVYDWTHADFAHATDLTTYLGNNIATGFRQTSEDDSVAVYTAVSDLFKQQLSNDLSTPERSALKSKTVKKLFG